ncbi:hypothetical protein pEaSNUABM29_00168 [Erwinia phage pEa_SNUABM_29]|nr:hypothetical protein pEaSNUABM29_00168 [Erwinia phage pEa_SNUABM_29]
MFKLHKNFQELTNCGLDVQKAANWKTIERSNVHGSNCYITWEKKDGVYFIFQISTVDNTTYLYAEDVLTIISIRGLQEILNGMGLLDTVLILTKFQELILLPELRFKSLMINITDAVTDDTIRMFAPLDADLYIKWRDEAKPGTIVNMEIAGAFTTQNYKELRGFGFTIGNQVYTF